MSLPEPLDALVVAPHPDDAELALGGTIARLLDAGWRVGVVDLTTGEPTPLGSEETRARETQAATQALGLPWRENLRLVNRSLVPDLEARRLLAGVFRRTRPRWVFAPHWLDAHPDHTAASRLVEEARFWAKLSKSDLPGRPHYPQRIWYYYSLHLRRVPDPLLVVDITPYWETKLRAVSSYRSQFVDPYPQGEFLQRVETQARFWGQMIGSQYGEPLTTREVLGVQDLCGLL